MDGATGYYAYQLRAFLQEQGYDVVVVTTYGGGGHRSENKDVIYVSQSYTGRKKVLRLYGSYMESRKLIGSALRVQADCYIVMTDPPLLNYWAARLMGGHHWCLWTMDLYPDAFVANGLIKKHHWLYKFYVRVLRSGQPQLLLTLGPQQGSYLKEHHYPYVSMIHWPIGIRQTKWSATEQEPRWYNKDKIVLGYIGNLGEAHDPQILIDIALSMNPKKHTLVLSCTGIYAQAVKKRLSNIKHVIWVADFVASNFRYIDIHVVSLRSSWTHICVPSKAVTAIQYGGAVLFYGSKDSDTYTYMQDVGWHLDDSQDVGQWIHTLTFREVQSKRRRASEVYHSLLEIREGGRQLLLEYLDENI